MERLYLFNDGLAEHLADGMSISTTALDDSGASTSAWTTASGIGNYMQNPTLSKVAFKGMEAGRTVRGGLEGQTAIWVYDPEDPASGEGITLTGTEIPGLRQNLISTFQICEELGFTKITRPSAEGPSGYYRRRDDGTEQYLPITVDKERGLYVMHITAARTMEDAKSAAGQKLHIMERLRGDHLCLTEQAKAEHEMQSMSPEQAKAYTARNGGRWNEAASTVADMTEHLYSLQNPLMEPEVLPIWSVDWQHLLPFGDDGSSDDDEEPTEDNIRRWTNVWFDQDEPIMPRSQRPGMRNESLEDLHRRLGHVGACKNCKVCATVRAKRRIETKPKREANRTPGEERIAQF